MQDAKIIYVKELLELIRCSSPGSLTTPQKELFNMIHRGYQIVSPCMYVFCISNDDLNEITTVQQLDDLE